MLSGGCGATVGAGYGIYTGYLCSRYDSYYNCAIQTTCSSVFGAFGGAYAGIFLGWMSPILAPVCCVCVPVAGGAMIVKYFDKDAKKRP